jgi:hypothetical protein
LHKKISEILKANNIDIIDEDTKMKRRVGEDKVEKVIQILDGQKITLKNQELGALLRSMRS